MHIFISSEAGSDDPGMYGFSPIFQLLRPGFQHFSLFLLIAGQFFLRNEERMGDNLRGVGFDGG